LFEHDVTASKYVVARASGLSTYAQLDAAYTSGDPRDFWGDVGSHEFDLWFEDLTDGVVRTLILANISDGVRAYQAFEITFNKPNID
jgi:hypothetical protein